MNQPAELISRPVDWLSANALSLIGAVVVLLAGWYLSRMLSRLVGNLLPRAYGVDRNFAPFLAQITRYGILIFAIITALSFLGVSSASIYTVLGAAGLAVALALQSTLANIAAGIMLVWLRPIAIGEYVVGDGVAGVVVEIGLFGTRLRSTSGLYIFTPNQKLWSSAITNHSREPRRRVDVNVTIPDTADVSKARAALLRVATSNPKVLADPPPSVHVDSFAGSNIVLQLRGWVATPDYLDVLRSTTEQAKLAINALLAGSAQRAVVEPAVDPHTATPSAQTPNLS